MSENVSSILGNEISEAIKSEKALKNSNAGLGEIFAYIDILKKKEVTLLSVLKHILINEKIENCPICDMKVNMIPGKDLDKNLYDLNSINEDDWLLP
jgi:hypothetical protein